MATVREETRKCWIRKAAIIPWKTIEEKYAEFFQSDTGMPEKTVPHSIGVLDDPKTVWILRQGTGGTVQGECVISTILDCLAIRTTSPLCHTARPLTQDWVMAVGSICYDYNLV